MKKILWVLAIVLVPFLIGAFIHESFVIQYKDHNILFPIISLVGIFIIFFFKDTLNFIKGLTWKLPTQVKGFIKIIMFLFVVLIIAITLYSFFVLYSYLSDSFGWGQGCEDYILDCLNV